jgi:hypothetical protein
MLTKKSPPPVPRDVAALGHWRFKEADPTRDPGTVVVHEQEAKTTQTTEVIVIDEAFDDEVSKEFVSYKEVLVINEHGGWFGVMMLFVAVSETGADNRIMTSPDGIAWTSRTSAANNEWRGVTWGNGLFIAVAASGSGIVS